MKKYHYYAINVYGILKNKIESDKIKDFDLPELKEELSSIGEKPYRAEQIFKWLYVDRVINFDNMTNLSLELREKLKNNYTMCNFNILKNTFE